ncbi:hypothetical protein M9458_017403, partial [Cirrhinus mrigala]
CKTQLSNDDNLCRICMDAIIDCVLLECGHMVTCTKCGKRMSECPICRHLNTVGRTSRSTCGPFCIRDS